MLYTLERAGYRNTSGVNLCEEELEQAEGFVRGALAHADAVEFLKGYGDDAFDFITAVNFLEHLSRDELLELLRQAQRVLRPQGTLVAMVPNAVSPFGQLTRHWDLTHEWAFTPNNFRQLAPLVGFVPEVEFRECGPVPYGIVSAARYALWQVVRVSIALRFLIEVGSTKDRIYTMDMLVRLRVPAR